MTEKKKLRAYWRSNLKYVVVLLIIWFLISYGAGVLFKDELNNIRLGGFKLGFWFAQQGAMYVYLMNRLDKKFGFDE